MSSRKVNIFKEVPVQSPKRNTFDLSHELKSSYKFGYLYPCLLMECVPGDKVNHVSTFMTRFAPLLSPVMHRVNITFHFFAVPLRLLSDFWEDFITGGQQGDQNPVLPYVTPVAVHTVGGFSPMEKGSLWDYLGLPVADSAGDAPTSQEQISILPFKAYQKIFSDYYRDPNTEDEVDLETSQVGDVSVKYVNNSWYDLRQRGWERDYFTSALPWAQRGPQVLMPISATGNKLVDADGDPVGYQKYLGTMPMFFGDGVLAVGDSFNPGVNVENAYLHIENSEITINDLRRSLAIQRWLENNARGGGRYIEQIQGHFNVRVPDYRLQRAEYLGGGKSPVQISEVLATAATEVNETEIPVGDMAGHGLSVGRTNRFSYYAQEHCYIMGIVNIQPVPSYDLGVERLWTRKTKFDWAWPELAHLGEQEILSKELYFDFTDDDGNNEVFGYTPRYAEWKFKPDRVTGDFRKELLFWTLTRSFTERPALDWKFLRMIEDSEYEVSFRRIFAVQDGTDYIWSQIFHKTFVKRPLPYFGVPSI